MTLKVTGHQWYWTYEYPDQGDFTFDSNMLSDDEATKPGEPRLLGVDNPVVVPVGASGPRARHRHRRHPLLVRAGARACRNTRCPAASTRPGSRSTEPGTYYGQCYQICGINHAFMPIEVQAVSKDDFDNWVDARQEEVRARTTAAPRRDRRRRGAVATDVGIETEWLREASDGYRSRHTPTTPHGDHGHHAGLRLRAGCFRPTTRTSARCT